MRWKWSEQLFPCLLSHIKNFFEVINNIFHFDNIAGETIFALFELRIVGRISFEKLQVFHYLPICFLHLFCHWVIRKLSFTTIFDIIINHLQWLFLTLQVKILRTQFIRQLLRVCSNNLKWTVDVNTLLETYWTNVTVFIRHVGVSTHVTCQVSSRPWIIKLKNQPLSVEL